MGIQRIFGFYDALSCDFRTGSTVPGWRMLLRNSEGSFYHSLFSFGSLIWFFGVVLLLLLF